VASNGKRNGGEGLKVALTRVRRQKTNSPGGRVCRPDYVEEEEYRANKAEEGRSGGAWRRRKTDKLQACNNEKKENSF